jgi:AcrR family transcriptional regulator
VPRSQERIAQEREFRRGRIADAAMRLFAEHGFSAVSVEQIAEASGYTRVSVYNHFRGKPMIYLYLIRRETDVLAGDIERRVAGAPQPLDAFRAFLEALIDSLEKQPSFFELYFLEHEDVERDMSPEELAELEGAKWRLVEVARNIFDRGVKAGVYKDIDAPTAGNLFYASLAGAILLYRTHEFRAPLPQFLRAVGHYFLRSVGAAEGPYALPFAAAPSPAQRRPQPAAGAVRKARR